MVKPSGLKVLAAVLLLLGLLVAGFFGLRAIFGHFTAVNTSSVNESVPKNFSISVPNDWELTIRDIVENKFRPSYHFYRYLGPVISVPVECSSQKNTGGYDFDRFQIEISTHDATETETIEIFKKNWERSLRRDFPDRTNLIIDEIDIGGKTPLFMYQIRSLTSCAINRFIGMAVTQDDKLFGLDIAGYQADYETDFKEILHSIRLQ